MPSAARQSAVTVPIRIRNTSASAPATNRCNLKSTGRKSSSATSRNPKTDPAPFDDTLRGKGLKRRKEKCGERKCNDGQPEFWLDRQPSPGCGQDGSHADAGKQRGIAYPIADCERLDTHLNLRPRLEMPNTMAPPSPPVLLDHSSKAGSKNGTRAAAAWPSTPDVRSYPPEKGNLTPTCQRPEQTRQVETDGRNK